MQIRSLLFHFTLGLVSASFVSGEGSVFTKDAGENGKGRVIDVSATSLRKNAMMELRQYHHRRSEAHQQQVKASRDVMSKKDKRQSNFDPESFVSNAIGNSNQGNTPTSDNTANQPNGDGGSVENNDYDGNSNSGNNNANQGNGQNGGLNSGGVNQGSSNLLPANGPTSRVPANKAVPTGNPMMSNVPTGNGGSVGNEGSDGENNGENGNTNEGTGQTGGENTGGANQGNSNSVPPNRGAASRVPANGGSPTGLPTTSNSPSGNCNNNPSPNGCAHEDGPSTGNPGWTCPSGGSGGSNGNEPTSRDLTSLRFSKRQSTPSYVATMNSWRCKFCLPPYTYDATLEQSAQRQGNDAASQGAMVETPPSGQGTVMAEGLGSDFQNAVLAWTCEVHTTNIDGCTCANIYTTYRFTWTERGHYDFLVGAQASEFGSIGCAYNDAMGGLWTCALGMK